MTALIEINNWTSRIDDAYASAVTAEDETAMSNHAFRVPDALWKAYGAACKAKGTTRSDDLRRYMTAEVAEHERKLRRIARENAPADES